MASIDLHADTFQPHNGTQCSIIFVEKKSDEEMIQERLAGVVPDYDIFMAMIDHIGHDKRGNTVYKRDKEGNLVLNHIETKVREIDESGEPIYRNESFEEKVVNDQTVLVPPVFNQWKREQGIVW